MIGKTLGQYKLLDEIGRGGMGVVYLAEHVELGTRYAVKVLPEELSASPAFIERFKTEARVMARLSHPAIVKVINLASSGDSYYLVMELVVSPDGTSKDLQALVEERGGRLPPGEVLDAVLQICEALEYAHIYRDDLVKNGVVHRDLKPANVLMDADGRFKVSDFGLAKIIGDEFILSKVRESFSTSVGGRPTRVLQPKGEGDEQPSTEATQADDWDGAEPTVEHKRMRTSSESILGTYDYMSPEQRDPARAGAVDRRSDIYALGVICYRLLTGHKPEGRFKLPSQINPELPAFWDTVIEETLQPDPDDRYSSCSKMMAFLADERPEVRARRAEEARRHEEDACKRAEEARRRQKEQRQRKKTQRQRRTRHGLRPRSRTPVMKKATRRKLVEWLITGALLVLLAVVVYYRFFVAPKQMPQRAPEWRPLEPVATVEIADTDEARATGLMGRQALGTDRGMYFVYPDLHTNPFYMKNTPIPLSIAFLDKDGAIISIKDMQPYDPTSVYPGSGTERIKYLDALEMNQGWFERNGIRVGDRAELKDGEVHFSRYYQ